MEEDLIAAQPGTVPDMQTPDSILIIEPETIQDAPQEPDKLAASGEAH